MNLDRHNLLGFMDLGHNSEAATMVPWNLYDAVESISKGSKASGYDQFVHAESSLLGLNRDILHKAKNEVWF